MFSQRFALDFRQLDNRFSCQFQHRRQLVLAERRFFPGPLDLHEPPSAGHHHVHIDVRFGIVNIIEVNNRFAINDSDADRGNAVGQRVLAGIRQVFLNGPNRFDQGDKTTGNAGGPSTAICLKNVAIDSNQAFAECLEVGNGPQASADQSLDFG